jgi:phage terminase large subunit
MYLYRELYGTRRLVEDWCRRVLDLVSDPDPSDPGSVKARIWREPKPKFVVCDHDAEGRATLERHLGRSTLPATKGVADGIQVLQKRYEIQGDGKPRIYFMKGACVERDRALVDAGQPASTIEEVPAYVWDTSNLIVMGSRETRVAEVPLKKNDHGQDATRYLAVELERGRPRVRRL